MEHIKIPKVDNVLLLDRYNSRKQVRGTFYITSTHSIFVDPEGKKEVWISHMHISTMERLPAMKSGFPLQIRGKNFINVTFVIPREKDCLDVQASLGVLSRPASLDDLYAFNYSGSNPDLKCEGWDFFDLQSEYLRMGVPNENWSLSLINKEYEICDTYPSLLFVPSTASTPMLISSAKFRSKGRLPVMSYLHRFNQASITRCSQPLVGFSARCLEDEALFQVIRKANPASRYLCVVDTRPKINALANRAQGKGYESESFYNNVKFQFFNIENIHVMRGSLQRLVEACEQQNPSMTTFLNGLESCGWLKHIKSIVDTSVFVANTVIDGISVVIHCSDGWDRTSQVSSLSSLMLDPYYRTIDGFQVLIEKEWLSFGHKFTERCGFTDATDIKETAPIFTQFLDCVWQLSQQFPRSFQFNEKYLITLHDHVYSCQFGTFLGCCEKDRVDLRLKDRTYSLWGYTCKYTRDFTNPFYEKALELEMPVILPVTNPQSFKLWRSMYCRYENGLHPRENICDVIQALKDHTESLVCHRGLLEKRISHLYHHLHLPFTEDTLKKSLQQLSSSDSIDFKTYFVNNNNNNSNNVEMNSNNNSNINSQHQHQHDDNNISTTTTATTLPTTTTTTTNIIDIINNSDNNKQQQQQQHRKPNINNNNDDNNNNDKNVDGGDDDDDSTLLNVDELLLELNSVATEWKSLKGVMYCGCAIPFEQHSMKHHCWSCGQIYCTRCIDRYAVLPGYMKHSPVPVCKSCFKAIFRSPLQSVDDFQKLQGTV